MLEYFGFQEEPFGITPDPRCLYLSRTHRDALAALESGFSSNRGFTAMMAPPGMGKTTLLFRFLEDTRDTARTVFLFDMDALCEPREFVSFILRDIGINPGSTSAERHTQLSAALDRENQAGRKFVVVIDEAQNLSDAVLERVRLLSNFETSRGKLMHVILSGQPLLAEKLIHPTHLQFRQRITTVRRIDPLSREEVVPYIDYRMKLAGYTGQPLFTEGALCLIAQASQGTPRTINNLCYDALSLCYTLHSKQVDGNMVSKVIADLHLIPPSKESISVEANIPSWQPAASESTLAARSVAVNEPIAPVQSAAPRQSVTQQTAAPRPPIAPRQPIATDLPVPPGQPRPMDRPDILGRSVMSARLKQSQPFLKRLVPSTAGYAMLWVPAVILLGYGALGLLPSDGVWGIQPHPFGSSESQQLNSQPSSGAAPKVAVTGTKETIQNRLPSQAVSSSSPTSSAPIAIASVPPVAPDSKPLPANSSIRKPSPSTRLPISPGQAPISNTGAASKLSPVAQSTLPEDTAAQSPASGADANSAASQQNPASASQSGLSEGASAATQVRPALAGGTPVTARTSAAPNVRPALPGINP